MHVVSSINLNAQQKGQSVYVIELVMCNVSIGL